MKWLQVMKQANISEGELILLLITDSENIASIIIQCDLCTCDAELQGRDN